MSDNLYPIDRFASEPLDVHKWSDHPEIKELVDTLYQDLSFNELESRSNNRGRISVKAMLRVLLLDLYVRWIKDPNLATGVQKSTHQFKPNSRYNGLFIGRKMIDVERVLEEQGYLDVLPHYNDRTGAGRSFSTRIRPSNKLRAIFSNLTIELHEIDTNYQQECVILREKYFDEQDNRSTNLDIEYTDTEYTNTIRHQLESYNQLLRKTFIDIPSFESATFHREITKGRRAGERTTISIGPDNKFVRRVFSGGLQGEWKLNGRFYGGWWQQIDSAYRNQIYINDEPTFEYDLKALHPNLLSNRAGVTLPEDPYTLPDAVIEGVSPDIQRRYVKLLVLMAVNASSPEDAYAAFRDNDRSDKIAVSLRNETLEQLLNAFFKYYPHMEQYLCKGLGLELMGIDGQIANMVIDYFTQQDEPVLCIHDSFLINYRRGEELRRVVEESTFQLTGHRIRQDIKTERLQTNLPVTGNIEPFSHPVQTTIYTPKRVNPTEEYKIRRDKFFRWRELTEQELVVDGNRSGE